MTLCGVRFSDWLGVLDLFYTPTPHRSQLQEVFFRRQLIVFRSPGWN